MTNPLAWIQIFPSVRWDAVTQIVEIPNANPINVPISPEEVKDVQALYNVDQLSKTLGLIKDVLGNYKDDKIRKELDLSFKTMPAANKLAERIRESDIFSRELHDATREFEEVARKYALSHAQKDVKIDVDVPKKRDIGGMGFDF